MSWEILKPRCGTFFEQSHHPFITTAVNRWNSWGIKEQQGHRIRSIDQIIAELLKAFSLTSLVLCSTKSRCFLAPFDAIRSKMNLKSGDSWSSEVGEEFVETHEWALKGPRLCRRYLLSQKQILLEICHFGHMDIT